MGNRSGNAFSYMLRPLAAVCALLVCFLTGCSSDTQPKADPIGDAFVGPASLKLRNDFGLDSPVTATVKHGERVLILQRRRRFLRVRAPNGAEGWTEMRQLLAADQMKELDRLAERASKMTSQGDATVYEPLNVHTETNRMSPSFYQVRDQEHIDVIEHLVTERIPFVSKNVLPPPVPKKKARKPKKEDEQRVRPPAPPPAPPPPSNWLELSKTLPDALEPKEEVPVKPVPKDDWTLVRMQNGRAGWVLTRMLKMNIPDEVAQYSEGQRITSYFDMAKIDDGGQIRHNWLWTTNSQNAVPWQFDGFRYFIWNTRRHRYETAYIERNLRGYLPVEIHPVTVTLNKKPETLTGFTLLVEEEDGQLYKKTYAYQIYLVKLVSKTKVVMDQAPAPAQGDESSTIRLASGKQIQVPASAEKPTLYARIKDNVTTWRRKLLGR